MAKPWLEKNFLHFFEELRDSSNKAFNDYLSPFAILSSAEEELTTINDALKLLSDATEGCIRFVERTTETNYVGIIKGNG